MGWVAPPVVEEEEEVAEMEAKTDEIRETVRALYRVFQLGDEASGNDYPALSRPTGWSGEVGNGPTTAYDCLPPKKYHHEFHQSRMHMRVQSSKSNETQHNARSYTVLIQTELMQQFK